VSRRKNRRIEQVSLTSVGVGRARRVGQRIFRASLGLESHVAGKRSARRGTSPDARLAACKGLRIRGRSRSRKVRPSVSPPIASWLESTLIASSEPNAGQSRAAKRLRTRNGDNGRSLITIELDHARSRRWIPAGRTRRNTIMCCGRHALWPTCVARFTNQSTGRHGMNVQPEP